MAVKMASTSRLVRHVEPSQLKGGRRLPGLAGRPLPLLRRPERLGGAGRGSRTGWPPGTKALPDAGLSGLSQRVTSRRRFSSSVLGRFLTQALSSGGLRCPQPLVSGLLRMIQLSCFLKYSTLVFFICWSASRGSVNPLLESGKGLVLGLYPSDEKLGTSALGSLMETDSHPRGLLMWKLRHF